ncbi:MAG: hypothetical protein ACI9OH_002692 [Oleispira sp.]|jgi:hypothetical protein
MEILELVTFKLANGISDEAFLVENEHLNHWVKSQPGFEYRALAQANDGSWTDTVFWQSMEAASAAQQRFGEEPSLQGMMKVIDMESVKVEHQKIHSMQAPL